jgi:hypothetical protein
MSGSHVKHYLTTMDKEDENAVVSLGRSVVGLM